MSPSRRSNVVKRHKQCVALELSSAVLDSIDSPLGRELAAALRRRDFSHIVKHPGINPWAYTDANDFRQDYLAVELLSKFPDFDLGIDRVAVALRKFSDSELQCSETNFRLKRSFGQASITWSMASVLYTAARKIERLLGPFSWDRAEPFFGFGPGATYSLGRRHGDAYYKLGCKPEVTRECAVLAYTALCRNPAWFSHVAGHLTQKDPGTVFTIVPGNRVTTVPKNAKTDRTIAIEPLMNMFVQKGIGGVIRHCLKRVGIDLNDQSLNQRQALVGSTDGSLATIDLSSASDTVSLELVRLLLPSDWFQAIELARSHVGALPDGSVITYQKVSSMGNGFTFELESLIFWALCSSVYQSLGVFGHQPAVYGDDIIVKTEAAAVLLDVLNYCGFTPNVKKTFIDGPFRESCGKHYFLGADVTPFYVREGVDSLSRLFWLANSIRRHASQRYPYGLDATYQEAYSRVLAHIPSRYRKPSIPDGYGDGGLIGDFDECRPKAFHSKKFCWWEGHEFYHFVERRTTVVPEDYPILLKSLFNLERRSGEAVDRIETSVPKQSHVARYNFVRSCAVQWVSKGPWV